MSDDDRDRAKAKTPPAGIAAQLARPVAESFDDQTPVNAPPDQSRARVGDIQAAQAVITSKVEGLVTQHETIKTEVAELRRGQATMNGHISDLRVESKGQSLSLAALVDESNISKEKKRALEIAIADAGVRSDNDLLLKRRDFKWSIMQKAAVGAIAIATFLATHYLERCRAPSAEAPAPASRAATGGAR